MEFFQSRMGRSFYENHVPRILKALEKIGSEMEKSRLASQEEVPTQKPSNIVVVVEGGMVTDVFTDGDPSSINVTVADCDMDGMEEERLMEVKTILENVQAEKMNSVMGNSTAAQSHVQDLLITIEGIQRLFADSE